MSQPPIPSTSSVDPYKELIPIKNVRLKLTSSQPFTPQYIQSTLAKSSNLDPQALYNARVKDRRIVLENPARASRAKREREMKKERREAQRKKKELQVMGRKEAEVRGSWRLAREHTKYNLFVPLHQLWLGYMSELLGLAPVPPDLSPTTKHTMPSSASMHPKLVKADFHGSIMTVKQSKNPCLVGISGIVIHETENAFKLITKRNQMKLIPKQNSIFTFRIPLYDIRPPSQTTSLTNSEADSAMAEEVQDATEDSESESPLTLSHRLPQIEFELYGNQFRFRAADRSSRKFKHKETIEL